MDETIERIKEADQLRDMEGKSSKALKILEKKGEEIMDDPLLSYDFPKILKKIAICYSDLGENEKAKEYFKEALEIAKKDLNKIETADIQVCLASWELNIGSIEKALEYALEAWEYIGKKRGDKFTETKINTAIVLGNIYFEQGEYKKAYKKYMVASRNAPTIGYVKGKVALAGELANYYIVHEKFKKALEIIGESIEEAEESYRILLPRLQMELSRIYYEEGNVEEAKETALKAYKFVKKRGLLKLLAESSEFLGRVYAEKNQAKADAYFKEAFDIYNKSGYNLPTQHPKEEDWFTSTEDL